MGDNPIAAASLGQVRMCVAPDFSNRLQHGDPVPSPQQSYTFLTRIQADKNKRLIDDTPWRSS